MTAARSISLPGRVRLDYVEQGDASGVPVLFLHGVTDSRRSFDLVLPRLPGWIRAFALTQRGHGDSEKPESGYRARDFAGDFAAFADALSLGPLVLVGHSMGATNAQRFTIDHPEKTRGLVLAGSFARYRGNAVIGEFWDSELAKLEDPVTDAFARAFQASTVARRVAPDFFEQAVAECLKVPARVWRRCFEAFLEDECTSELGRIRAPTLLVWGDRDAFASRADQDMLLASILGSRLSVHEGGGHAVHWEDPRRFAAEVTAFCESLSPAIAGGAR